jgi:ParB family chromosome partitioning protein
MSENTPNSSNNPKKARLGRGLGSLLGGSSSVGSMSADPTPSQASSSVESKIEKKEVSTQGTAQNATQALKANEHLQATKPVAAQLAPTHAQPAVPSKNKVEASLSKKALPDTNNASVNKVVSASNLTANAKQTTPVAVTPVVAKHLAANTAQAATVAVAATSAGAVATTDKQVAATTIVAPTTAMSVASVNAVSAPNAGRPVNEESQIWNIPVDRLRPNTQQPRRTFTPDALRDLTASVKEKGILQPIVARRIGEREFEIIAGERRWRAAQAAGLHQVPVILKKVTEQDSLELAIIENIQRENLNPLEEAEAYERLLSDYSLTQQQVAEKLGKERSTVANMLRLLALPPEVKQMLRKGELSAGHAKVLLGVDNAKTQIEIARQIISEKLSVRATEKLVTKAKAKAGFKDPFESEDEKVGSNISFRAINALSAELQKLVGTKISIDYAEGKGKLAVHFYSDDHLNQVIEKIRKAWEK